MEININDLAKVQGIGPKTLERVRELARKKEKYNTENKFTPPLLGVNKLHVGRAEKLLDHIPNNYISLTVTSPPYESLRDYEGFTFNFEPIAKKLYRVTKEGGIVVWIVDDTTSNFCESLTSFKQQIFFVEQCGFNLLDTMIWVKPNYAPGYPTLRRYDNNFEFMFVLSKGKPKIYNLIEDKPKKQSSIERSKYKTSFATSDGRVKSDSTFNNKKVCRRTNVWKIPNGQIRGLDHPAPFPPQIAKDHITSWSSPGDIVLDPMCGSGTTLEQAVLLNRRFIGIDISKKYVENIARPRVKEAMNLAKKEFEQ